MRSIIVLLLFLIVFVRSMSHPMPEKKTQQNQPVPEAVLKDSPAAASGGTVQGVTFKVNVYDADGKVPIELARIVLTRNGKFISEEVTAPTGQARFRDIAPGSYIVQAWFVGYRTFSDSTRIDNDHSSLEILLQASGNTENNVDVVGQREIAVTSINLNTGNQVFESETFHPTPTAQMTNLVQENILGAARAPTGEVHIRGQHGEFTYYVDGLPVPLGVFGGLNDVVDQKVIDRATFITGGFSAEYGGQNAAIIDLKNRVPTGAFHLDASTYIGSYLTSDPSEESERVGPFRAVNSNGQALSLSDHVGNLGFFLSGSRQETDRRIDQPVENLFHDHGQDYFLYGKADYLLSDVDYVTANINFGRTSTQIPFDSVEQIANDMQTTTNAFQTLSYFRTINADADHESNFFAGVYAREGGLNYSPGSNDPALSQFVGDTNSYLIAEDRSFTTLGIRSTYDKRISHEFMYKAGFNFSSTTGVENFTSHDSTSNAGPSLVTDFSGSDFGVFLQADWHPMEWTSFELGARYDQHIAPDMPLQSQISPRLRWNFLIDEDNTVYLYYGRMFMPTNIEGLKSIAVNFNGSDVALVPTLPERDDFYEAVYTHLFPFGLRSKADVFYKYATPGVDDQTIGSSAIKTPVNIAQVRTTGIELGLSYSDPVIPFSGYVNTSIIHAYGSGVISGGFLPLDSDGPATDLDHDQRLSIVSGFNYQPQDWFINVVAIYGSGLTNGNAISFGTGLFDFNQ
ncbi:MAG TPA: TonB-dependent receptor, partial [Bacteroidota bacterium]|nr:TonB-dependent receptor [Bacteroidota bacterium]